jgi:hypothetical protein
MKYLLRNMKCALHMKVSLRDDFESKKVRSQIVNGPFLHIVSAGNTSCAKRTSFVEASAAERGEKSFCAPC